MFILSFETITFHFRVIFPHLVPFISIWDIFGWEIEIYLFCFNPFLFCIVLHVVVFFQSEMKVSLWEQEAFSKVSLYYILILLHWERDGGRGEIATNKLSRETVAPASSSVLALEWRQTLNHWNETSAWRMIFNELQTERWTEKPALTFQAQCGQIVSTISLLI